MIKKSNSSFSETAVLHKGYVPKWSEGEATVPIFMSSTAVFSSPEAGKQAFKTALTGGVGGELIYSRVNHPNAQILEERVVSCEPLGETAAVFTSGMSAIVAVVMALLPRDKKLIFSNSLYGGTYCFFQDYLKPHLGFNVLPVNTSNVGATARAIKSAGKNLGMVFLETPANPTMAMTNIAAIAKLAKKANPKCVVVVDNTLMGIFQQPFVISPEVDLVVYSATKFMGGHSNLTAGVVIARAESNEMIKGIKVMRILLGSILTPFPAWQLLGYLPTYKLRMEKQAKKATKIANYLASQSEVKLVLHPSLLQPGDPGYHTYQAQCSGPSSIIAFYLKSGGEHKAFKFLKAVAKSSTILLAVSLGCVESLIEHPASMTHSEMSKIQQLEAGITSNLIRLSVGLENVGDIIEALAKGFKAIK